MLFLPDTPLVDNVFCFTTSIHGGVSQGIYKSFNLGNHVGDSQHRVATNRELLRAIVEQQVANRKASEDLNEDIMLAPIKWLNQQHSVTVTCYDDISANESQIADGIYTDTTSTPLVVMSADCLPLVFACHESNRIAAVHVGWRGLLDGIVHNTLAKFVKPSAVSVWIGPHISQENFQVGSDVIERFSAYKDMIDVSLSSNKYFIDLTAIALKQLTEIGVTHLQHSSQCTYNNMDCFSHRRATQQGAYQTGRMATVIVSL